MGIISWKTKKAENGTYTMVVREIDYQKPVILLKQIEGFKTRARATGAAHRWSRYFKSQQKAAA